MKNIIIILVLFVAIAASAYSLGQIAVQNGSTVNFYTDLQTAVNAAPTGSDIYLPGTSYGKVNVAKKLNFYGTGHYPAATTTVATNIDTMNLQKGCDSSNFAGIKFNRIIPTYGTDTTKCISFNRCFINLFYATEINAKSIMRNYFFKESIIQQLSYGSWGIDTKFIECYFMNCFIGSNATYCSIDLSESSLYVNCIYLSTDVFGYTATSNVIKNSIFASSTLSGFGTGNTYQNNLCVNNVTSWGSNIALNNLVNKALSTIFVNVTANQAFSYSYDYHQKPDSPGKNYGTDTTDVGIYGSTTPYKENAIPIIPYINAYNTAVQTVNGKLEISVDVQSQTK
jgi:hypothetical protein